jgi:hypothetical protein
MANIDGILSECPSNQALYKKNNTKNTNLVQVFIRKNIKMTCLSQPLDKLKNVRKDLKVVIL